MTRYITSVVFILLIVTACSDDNADPASLPTLAEQRADTAEPTDTIAPEATTTPTHTPAITATPSETLPPSETPIPTETPLPTATFTPSVTPTFYFSATTVGNVPVFATLTPAPNVNPPATPVVAADIVITEQQFQQTITDRIVTTASIDSAVINFVPGPDQGISVRLTAPGGQAMISGDVFIAFTTTQSFVSISVTRIDVASGGEIPQRYLDTVVNELYPLITDTFDDLITSYLGDDHDLEVLRFSNNAMEIKLLVPEP